MRLYPVRPSNPRCYIEGESPHLKRYIQSEVCFEAAKWLREVARRLDGPDAIRFTITRDEGAVLRLYYVAERDHLVRQAARARAAQADPVSGSDRGT